MARIDELNAIFENIDAEKRGVVQPLLTDVVFLEERLAYLRTLPTIRVHPMDKARQEVTAAGKQYKEMLQQYNNCLKILLMTLYRTESNGADELLAKLKEFEV